jgi:AcrR family transcriptional regulator
VSAAVARKKRRDKILDAAISLFSLQGFSGTTTLQIAKAAGVTEPLIYYYYKDKDELFNQILAQVLSACIERLEVIESLDIAPFDKIEALIHEHVAIVDDMSDGIRLVVRSCPARLHDPDDICRQVYLNARTKMKTIIEDSLRQGVEAGVFFPC